MIIDETIMVDYPHGNAKKSTSAYYATAPSVRKDIAKKSKTTLPTAIMNSFKTAPQTLTTTEDGGRDLNPVLTPRNKSQVCLIVTIDDIAFEFLAMHCGIGRGVKQKKISHE